MTETHDTAPQPVATGIDPPAVGRSFTARGSRNGSQVWVRWTEGQLEGDPPTADLIRVEADIGIANADDPILGDGFARACRGATDRQLAEPGFVHLLVCRVFDSVREISCSPPELLHPPTP